jgi:hypothetical protein
MSTSSSRLASYFAADNALSGRRRGRADGTTRVAVRSAMGVDHHLDATPGRGRQRGEGRGRVGQSDGLADQLLGVDEPFGDHSHDARQVVPVSEAAHQRAFEERQSAGVDGARLGNASQHSNLDYEQLAREILKEAARIDAAEDELYGEQRGDELPEQLRTSEGRRAALTDARRKLERDRAKGSTDAEMADLTQSPGVALELDREVIVA